MWAPWFPQPLCSSPQFPSPPSLTSGLVLLLSVLSCDTLSIIMFSKAVFTFLAIGALWVNVLAAPIPTIVTRANGGGYSPLPSYDASENSRPSTPSSFDPRPLVLAGNHPVPSPEESRSKWKKFAIAGELPRSFSALPYRDLTFVFSVGGGLVALGGIGGTAYLAFHNNTRREFGLESEDPNSVPLLPVIKREPVSEDGASDSISSPLKREPKPAPPSL